MFTVRSARARTSRTITNQRSFAPVFNFPRARVGLTSGSCGDPMAAGPITGNGALTFHDF